MEDRFGGTPKPARQRHALPGMFALMRVCLTGTPSLQVPQERVS